MKRLLIKEIRLAASPLSWWFLAFALMALIPGYPILVGTFFVTLGIFYSFQSGRECNDILYTALLPIEKQDVVRAKFAFTVLVELTALLAGAILTILRMTALSDAIVYVENPMMNANLAYLGYILLIFAAFNTIFLPGFFKTAYAIGKPFFGYAAVSFLIVVLGEALHRVPGLEALNAPDAAGVGGQCVVLAAGLLACGLGTYRALRRSEKRFEELDL